MGAVSHSVADILWHDIDDVHQKTAQGLIRAQAEIYFFGDYSQSHTAADVGGEFATASQASTSWISTSWFIPTFDILATYASMGYHVSPDDLSRGMLEGWADVQLSSLVWRFADPLVQRLTPFLQEEMPYYFVGGMDDSAQWSARCWPNFIAWLENGSDLRRLCLVEPPTNATESRKRTSSSHLRHAKETLLALPSYASLRASLLKFVSLKPLADGNGHFISLERPLEGIIHHLGAQRIAQLSYELLKISAPHRLRKHLDLIYAESSTERASSSLLGCQTTDQLRNVIRISSDVYYANLGASLAQGDFNGDGTMDIAIGAPGYTAQLGRQQAGAVFLFPVPSTLDGQTTLLASHLDPSTISLLGNVRSGRFGSALATVDLNRDGFDDLVVSEPRFGNDDLSYRGRIFVLYGSETGLSLGRSTLISLDGAVGNFTMMGTSLSSGDLDKDGYADLIIGSPHSCRLDGPCNHLETEALLQSGAVSIFLSSNWTVAHSLQLTDADVTLQGASKYSWFGTRTIPFVDKQLRNLTSLIISSPIAGYSATISAPGSVSSYDWNSISANHSAREPRRRKNAPLPATTMNIDSASSKLGWSISLGNPFSKSYGSTFAAIGAPTDAPTAPNGLFDPGSVYLPPAETLSKSSPNGSVLVISGSESLGRFGWSTLLDDLDGDGFDDLVVSAPFESDQAGRLYVWSGGSHFPTSSTTSASRDLCLELPPASNPPSRSRFGHLLFSASSGLKDDRYLIATSPRDSVLQQEGGSVYLIKVS